MKPSCAKLIPSFSQLDLYWHSLRQFSSKHQELQLSCNKLLHRAQKHDTRSTFTIFSGNFIVMRRVSYFFWLKYSKIPKKVDVNDLLVQILFQTFWINWTRLWVNAAAAPFCWCCSRLSFVPSLNLVPISIGFPSDSRKCPHNYPSMKCLTAKSQWFHVSSPALLSPALFNFKTLKHHEGGLKTIMIHGFIFKSAYFPHQDY